MASKARPTSVGIGYRSAIAEWTRANLDRFDVLEVTVDHCIHAGASLRAEIFDLVGQIPLTAHGIGLSIGTDTPLDLAYLDQVAAIVDRLKAPAYSEHLAFTRVPGRDLANLLPLPKTEAVAEAIIAKVRIVQSRVPVPFLLENITYLFEWPDSTMSDAAFFNLICRETGAGILLDIENVYLNAENHRFDACAFLDGLSTGLVREVHMAGGITVRDPRLGRPILADSHSHPVPEEALALFDYALERHRPHTIIVERDDRLDAGAEILDDVTRIRARLDTSGKARRESAKPVSRRLLDRQVDLLDYLTSAEAIFGDSRAPPPASLHGIDPALLQIEAHFSHEKRMEKIAGVFPRTLELLAGEQAEILCAFAAACPPTSIGRLETAQQFCEFLCECRQGGPGSAYLRDVAACELALATARARGEEGWADDAAGPPGAVGKSGSSNIIRRGQNAVLLRCEHDVRPIFENDSDPIKPVRRDTPLVIARPPGETDPLIFEVPAPIFDLLAALDEWTEKACFGVTPEAQALIADLAERGILDVRA
jgi:uncharacterized protein (UPF0276 family)